MIKIAITSRTFFFLPLMAALHRGEFNDAGVPVEIVHLDGRDSMTGLDVGEYQFASTPPESVIGRIEEGTDSIRFVAGIIAKLSHSLIAQPKYKTISDLKGARFGCVSLEEGSRFQFDEIMAQNGLTPADYSIIPCGGAPTRWKLLQSGEIDAGLQSIPFTYMAEDAGFSNLGLVDAYFPHYQFGAWSANLDWAKENEETVSTVLKVLIRSTRWMLRVENKEEAVAIAEAELGIPPPYAERAWQDFKERELFDPDLATSEAGLVAVVDLMSRTGLLPKSVTARPENYAYNQFRQKALAEIAELNVAAR